MRRALTVSLVALGFFAAVSDVVAQEAEEPPVWVITSIKVPPTIDDECLAAQDRTVTPINDELERRGLLLEQIVLRHLYADEWNVLVLNKYPTWNGIDAANDAFDEIRQEMYSEEEWEAFITETEGCSPDFHRDQIYTEHVPEPAGSE